MGLWGGRGAANPGRVAEGLPVFKYPAELPVSGARDEIVAAIGDDQDLRGGIRCGSLLVEEMTIAGA